MGDTAGVNHIPPAPRPAGPGDVAPLEAAPEAVQEALLGWAEGHLRDLPWRRTRDPWRVLVAEVMLQQTGVARVLEAYERFCARFPTAAACAAAPPAAVVEMWAGLGYNRRALYLHAAASRITAGGGHFPRSLEGLLALPGVGPYTARAVLALAFEEDIGVVDTNVGRLLARLGGRRLTGAAAQETADRLVPAGRAWQWNQALFDLGATVCTRRNPACRHCPLRTCCSWRGEGPDPADGSAGVSAVQSRFEGSDRQGRGRLVEALRSGPQPLSAATALMGIDGDQQRAERILASLTADGLVIERGDTLQLPT